MILTRDRAEGFALRAFAAARCAEKEKGLVSHAKPAYIAKRTASASPVIPSEIQGQVELPVAVATGSSTPLR